MALLALVFAGFFPGAQPRAAEVCHDDMSTAASRLDDATAQHVEIGIGRARRRPFWTRRGCGSYRSRPLTKLFSRKPRASRILRPSVLSAFRGWF